MGAVPYMKRMDHFEFDSRFSNANKIPYDDIRESDVSYDEIRPLLSKLPDREIDLMELYYRHKKNQKDIAKMFGVTQGAVSSRLSRARKRLKFLRDMPKISEEEIQENLGRVFDTMELEIITSMMKTTCQSKTASLINEKFGLKEEKKKMTQVKVRHRFEKCISCLQEKSKDRSDMKEYLNFLLFLKKNLYKLHEVKLPHFDRGKYAVFSLST